MKIEVIKESGGLFRPASDMEYEKTTKYKTGELYTAEIKLTRNPQFHRKVFAFFNFCFQHWSGDIECEFMDETAQFDVFRKQLTILAGYRTSVINLRTLKGSYEAKSLSFGSMAQDEFEQCYNALIQAAMKHIFKTADSNTYNQLISFF